MPLKKENLKNVKVLSIYLGSYYNIKAILFAYRLLQFSLSKIKKYILVSIHINLIPQNFHITNKIYKVLN